MKKELKILAKEKGFDLPVKPIGQWNSLIKEFTWISTDNFLWLCELQKWLRKNHKIHVEVNADHDNNTKEVWDDSFILTVKTDGYIFENFVGEEYEEALEVGLLEGLKLIKE